MNWETQGFSGYNTATKVYATGDKGHMRTQPVRIRVAGMAGEVQKDKWYLRGELELMEP